VKRYSQVGLDCKRIGKAICKIFYSDNQNRITSTEELTHYCILLPKLSMHGMPDINDDPIFTLIDSEWKEIQPDATILLPKIAGSHYGEVE